MRISLGIAAYMPAQLQHRFSNYDVFALIDTLSIVCLTWGCEIWSFVLKWPVDGLRSSHGDTLVVQNIAHFFNFRNSFFQVVHRKRLASILLIPWPIFLVSVGLQTDSFTVGNDILLSSQCLVGTVFSDLLSLQQWRVARGRFQLVPRSPPQGGPIRCSCTQGIPAALAQ